MPIIPLILGLMLVVPASCFGRQGLVRLAHLELRGGSAAALACLAQLYVVFTQQYRLELLLVTAVLVAIFLWLNRRHAGMILASIGICLNLAVMGSNGGAMPIPRERVTNTTDQPIPTGAALRLSKDVVLDDHEAMLPWLGDRFHLPGAAGRLVAWSLGDMLLFAGVGQLLWQTMKGDAYAGAYARRRPTLLP